jgi:hypothetical protein
LLILTNKWLTIICWIGGSGEVQSDDGQYRW